MKIPYGTIIAVAAALFFYLRLIVLQRQKLKQKSTQGKPKQGKKANAPKKATLGIEISSPYLLGLGILLVLFGAILSNAQWFPANYSNFWWVPVSSGIVLMSLAIH